MWGPPPGTRPRGEYGASQARLIIRMMTRAAAFLVHVLLAGSCGAGRAVRQGATLVIIIINSSTTQPPAPPLLSPHPALRAVSTTPHTDRPLTGRRLDDAACPADACPVITFGGTNDGHHTELAGTYRCQGVYEDYPYYVHDSVTDGNAEYRGGVYLYRNHYNGRWFISNEGTNSGTIYWYATAGVSETDDDFNLESPTDEGAEWRVSAGGSEWPAQPGMTATCATPTAAPTVLPTTPSPSLVPTTPSPSPAPTRACDPGTYLRPAVDGGGCIACAPGTYSAASGSTTCAVCDAGRVAPSSRSTSCDKCAG